MAEGGCERLWIVDGSCGGGFGWCFGGGVVAEVCALVDALAWLRALIWWSGILFMALWQVGGVDMWLVFWGVIAEVCALVDAFGWLLWLIPWSVLLFLFIGLVVVAECLVALVDVISTVIASLVWLL